VIGAPTTIAPVFSAMKVRIFRRGAAHRRRGQRLARRLLGEIDPALLRASRARDQHDQQHHERNAPVYGVGADADAR
jgi:hypothetical protein